MLLLFNHFSFRGYLFLLSTRYFDYWLFVFLFHFLNSYLFCSNKFSNKYRDVASFPVATQSIAAKTPTGLKSILLKQQTWRLQPETEFKINILIANFSTKKNIKAIKLSGRSLFLGGRHGVVASCVLVHCNLLMFTDASRELQRHGGLWHYCTCTVGREPNMFSVYVLGEQLL